MCLSTSCFSQRRIPLKINLNLKFPNICILIIMLGHAPAGGCVLSMCCDSRIMVNGISKIGLNESKVGIVAPYW